MSTPSRNGRASTRSQPVPTPVMYNQDAERSVLGAVLVHNPNLHLVTPIVGPSDFFDPHRRIFETMLAMTASDVPIDQLSLNIALERRGDLDNVNGPAYVGALADGVPKHTNVEYHARVVRDYSVARALHDHLTKASSRLGGAADIADVFAVLESGLAGIHARWRYPESSAQPQWEGGDGRYVLTYTNPTIVFDVDRLRWERGELLCELTVRAQVPGLRTPIDDVLSIGTFTVSNPRARQERGKLLKDLSGSGGDFPQWWRMIEELAVRVLRAERTGAPGVLLHEVPAPIEDDHYEVAGLFLPTEAPAILFGDGETLKSYTGLYVVGELAMRGVRVGYFDWELTEKVHRKRLAQLFGPDMPRVRYVRCEQPLIYEVDRLLRICREDDLHYAVCDSVAFATNGPPEAAESATAYYRATRQLRIGTLGVAHVTHQQHRDAAAESERAAKRTLRPFGSVFWHNGARATYFVRRAEQDDRTALVALGFYQQKTNLDAPRPPAGLTVTFTDDRAFVEPLDVGDVDDLADSLPLHSRITTALKRGPQTITALVERLDAKENSVKQALRRGQQRGRFVALTDEKGGVQRWALLERDHNDT